MSHFTTSLLTAVGFTTLAFSLGACGSTVIGGDGDDDPQTCEGQPRPLSDGWCPPAWSCVDGEWVDTAGACPQPTCPMNRPGDGESCELIGQSCFYEELVDCGGGGGTVTATCTEEGWQTAWPRCQPPLECPTELPEAGTDCTGWDYAYYCQFAVQKSCGEVYAVAACNYVDGGMLWDVQIPQNCGGCADHVGADGCEADGACRWLVPGCSENPLPTAGCFPKDDCTTTGCTDAQVCATVTVDPCWDSLCEACGASASVCLPN